VPLFIAVDPEGGLVVRVTVGATIFPGNMAVGSQRRSALARRVAEASATELLAMGVNMNLAPVVDVVQSAQSRDRYALVRFGRQHGCQLTGRRSWACSAAG
jgi:beta-N-acetylhexosaminidase